MSPDKDKILKGWERCKTCNMSPIENCDSYLNCEYTTGLYCRKDKLIDETLELIKEQSAVKTYGKLYSVSPNVAIEQRNTLDQKLYEDICKCLMENGVLILHSEGTPVDVTYGWKLKGVPYERPSEEH